jgi:DNA polymerase III subunit beta
MKFTIEATTLRQAARCAALVVAKRASVPVLSNVLIEACGAWVSLRGTDIDNELSETVTAERIEAEGAATVNAKSLLALAKGWAKGSLVEVEQDGGRLIFRNRRSSADLATLRADDMPKMVNRERPHVFTLPAATLLAEIERVRHAISSEETRYYLNGIFWHAQGASLLRMVAIDGHRLAKSEIDVPAGATGMAPVIIPRATVEVLRKILSGRNRPAVQAQIGKDQLRFAMGGTVLLAKPVDGTFPDYERVIPRLNGITIEADRRALADTLRHLVRPSHRYGYGPAVKFDALGDDMMLSLQDDDGQATMTEHLPASVNQPIKVGLNPRYVLDMLGAMSGERVELHLSDSMSPVLVQDGRSEFVIMSYRR